MHIETYTMDIYGYCACVVVCVFDLKILACRPCKYPLDHFPARIISWYQLLSESSSHDPKGVHDTFGGVLSLSPSLSIAISESSEMFRSWRLPTKIWLQQKRPGFSAHLSLALQRVRSIKNNLNNLTVVNGRGGQPFHHELTSWWCLRQFQPCSPHSSRRPSSQNIVLSAKMAPQNLMII